jgi:hypothetical protein
MTPDLRYLAFTAMLTASLWIPYVVCQVMTNGMLTPANYVDPTPRPLPLWGKRADRAAIFFWARLAHAVVYWFAIPYVRTLVFTAGYVSIAGIFWEIVR